MDNKIISIEDARKKSKTMRYKLKAQISVSITRNKEECSIDWSSPDDISKKDIYIILKNVFRDMIKEIPTIKYDKNASYDICFSLLYYQKDQRDIKYIFIPQNISKEKILEYIWLSINVYELKEKGIL